MSDNNAAPKIHGLCDVPTPFREYGGKSKFARKILDQLPYNSDQALKVEFSSHDEANQMRRCLHYNGYVKYGGQGNLRIKISGNFLFIWLIKEPAMNFFEVDEFINSHV
jgi:hypothetical protein